MPMLMLLLALAVPLPCRTGTLGIEVTNISRSLRNSREIPSYVGGALVRVVPKKSPAAQGGLEAGDVIQAVGGNLVQNVCDFNKAMEGHGCDQVHLAIHRRMKTLSLDVYLGDASRFERPKATNQDACRDGDGAACVALAQAHDQSVDLLRLGCDLGDANGCYLLALKLGNTKEGGAAYEAACDGGNSLACTNIGFMYERGEGVNKDLAEAARLYKLGCKGSSCTSPNNLGCVNLGRFYRDGIGLNQDPRQALRIFRDVCERKPVDDEDGGNISRSCSLAGTLMLYGKNMPHDLTRGIGLLSKGCEGNDTFGCYNLAVIYENGEGVTADRDKAIVYYQRSCDHGDTEACERIAVLKK